MARAQSLSPPSEERAAAGKWCLKDTSTHYQLVVGQLGGLNVVPVQAKFVGRLLRLVEDPVNDERFTARPAVEADGVLAEDRPPVAKRAADLHAAKQPQHGDTQGAAERPALRRE